MKLLAGHMRIPAPWSVHNRPEKTRNAPRAVRTGRSVRSLLETVATAASAAPRGPLWWSSTSYHEAPRTHGGGAFALASGSRDGAILVTLPAGNYTANVSGVAGTTGTALVEIYVVN